MWFVRYRTVYYFAKVDVVRQISHRILTVSNHQVDRLVSFVHKKSQLPARTTGGDLLTMGVADDSQPFAVPPFERDQTHRLRHRVNTVNAHRRITTAAAKSLADSSHHAPIALETVDTFDAPVADENVSPIHDEIGRGDMIAAGRPLRDLGKLRSALSVVVVIMRDHLHRRRPPAIDAIHPCD